MRVGLTAGARGARANEGAAGMAALAATAAKPDRTPRRGRQHTQEGPPVKPSLRPKPVRLPSICPLPSRLDRTHAIQGGSIPFCFRMAATSSDVSSFSNAFAACEDADFVVSDAA